MVDHKRLFARRDIWFLKTQRLPYADVKLQAYSPNGSIAVAATDRRAN
jgi:hypothetical protein